jgi:hypothetical protein
MSARRLSADVAKADFLTTAMGRPLPLIISRIRPFTEFNCRLSLGQTWPSIVKSCSHMQRLTVKSTHKSTPMIDVVDVGTDSHPNIRQNTC